MIVDYVIIGAGIVGISIALELKRRFPEARILILEKESTIGYHASGRNSGVLHTGIYYEPGSLKAKVCSQGAIEMAEFHREHGLRLNNIGKVLVGSDPSSFSQLNLLYERSKQHGIYVEWLNEQQLKEVEPGARSASGAALLVPTTAVGDPKGVLVKLEKKMREVGVMYQLCAAVESIKINQRSLQTRDGQTIFYGHLVNAAGLHADIISHKFEVGLNYTLLPFKGVYWKLRPEAGLRFNHLIYPVPDLRVPFLGIHVTITVDGLTYFGPTAIPAFGRENYRLFEGLSLGETARISNLLVQQISQNKNGFRRLAWQEGRNYFKNWFSEAVQSIAPKVQKEYLQASSKVGIRAQIYDKNARQLVHDFLIIDGEHSTHILNAISPAWTCAFPFARLVCDKYI